MIMSADTHRVDCNQYITYKNIKCTFLLKIYSKRLYTHVDSIYKKCYNPVSFVAKNISVYKILI